MGQFLYQKAKPLVFLHSLPSLSASSTSSIKMADTIEKTLENPPTNGNPTTENLNPTPSLSKSAQKKLVKQQKYEEKKAQKKAAMKEHKKKEGERKRKEWDEKLSTVSEEEKLKLIESRRELRKERMGIRSEEKEKKIERMMKAKEIGQKIIIDLDFADLMTPTEINSLVQQIMYCYAVNGRCSSPAHLWLTGCGGDMEAPLQRIPGFDKWLIEKEKLSYIEALQDQKENLVYLTADSETIVDELDPKKIYIIGGLVDRNRWKGLTMKKANDQGIQTAKLPIGSYLKMSSSQVLTVNQVFEILLKFVETKDWKTSFFDVIPQRKRGEAETREDQEREYKEDEEEHKEEEEEISEERKKKCIEQPSAFEGNLLTEAST